MDIGAIQMHQCVGVTDLQGHNTAPKQRLCSPCTSIIEVGNPLKSKFVNPVTSKFVIPLESRFVNPVTSKFVNPLKSKFVNPVTSKFVNPLKSKFVNPVTSKFVRQHSLRESYPSCSCITALSLVCGYAICPAFLSAR